MGRRREFYAQGLFAAADQKIQLPFSVLFPRTFFAPISKSGNTYLNRTSLLFFVGTT